MQDNRKAKRAAALKYDPLIDSAPIIAAVGSGEVAEKILEAADEHGVPIVEDSTTANILSEFSVGDAIPPALYEAVAQVLIFVADMDSRTKEKLMRGRP